MTFKSFKANIQKEIWEYKKIFIWLPIAVAGLVVLAPLMNFIFNDEMSFHGLYQVERLAEVQHSPEFANLVFGLMSAIFAPFIVVAIVVQFYYFVACLFDERRDLSVLFWRSLPVSDAHSIGIKLVVGALVLPGLFFLAATATIGLFMLLAFLSCLVFSVGYDISLWGLWISGGWIGNLLSLWLSLIPYALWLFPIYAWLMLASVYAKKAPFLWAVLPVVAIIVIENIIGHYVGLSEPLFSNMLQQYLHVSVNPEQFRIDEAHFGWATVKVISAQISLVGLVVGAAFIYATYWLRLHRSH